MTHRINNFAQGVLLSHLKSLRVRVVKREVERMLRSVAWANRESLAALRSNPAAVDEALPLIAHILAAEHVWLCRLRRQEPRLSVWPTLTLVECDALASENAEGYTNYLGALDEGDFGSFVTFRTSKGDEYTMMVGDILIHVVTHGAYHRGQIAQVIGRNAGQSVNTDYINFARLVEPIDSQQKLTS